MYRARTARHQQPFTLPPSCHHLLQLGSERGRQSQLGYRDATGSPYCLPQRDCGGGLELTPAHPPAYPAAHLWPTRASAPLTSQAT